MQTAVSKKTVILGEPPQVVLSLIAERQRLGLDRHDEIWEGDYHMVPAASFEHASSGGRLVRFLGDRADEVGLQTCLEFNLGEPRNFRVPDLGFHRGSPSGAWIPTAAVVVEIRSPDDESYEKFAFYFERGVEEMLIADLETRTVRWFVRGADAFVEATASAVLGVSTDDVAGVLGWS
jgi:Uma2 family endonuclease